MLLGFDVHLLAFYREDYPNARFLNTQGVKIYPKQIASLYTEDIAEWILQQAAQIQPDVFIPDGSTPGCFAGKWLRASRIPVISAHRSDDETKGRATYFGSARSPYASTGIVCVSAYLRDELIRRVRNPKLLTKVIPSGVEIPDGV